MLATLRITIGIWAWLFLAVVSPLIMDAVAQNTITEQFKSGPWHGSVQYDASGGGFQNCLIFSKNRNGDSLVFELTKDSHFLLSIHNKNWNLPEGFEFKSVGLLDRTYRYELAGLRLQTTAITFPLKHNLNEIELFRAGEVFQITTPFGPKSFSLRGTRKALNKLVQCRDFHGQKSYFESISANPIDDRQTDTILQNGFRSVRGDAIGVLSDIDIPGGDYRTIKLTTFQNCLHICRAEKRCAAFTFNQQAQMCFLKDVVGQKVRFVGAKSGFKKSKQIAGSIGATRMIDICSYSPANVDVAISVMGNGVIPKGYSIKKSINQKSKNAELNFWNLESSEEAIGDTDLNLIFLKTGRQKYYWCSEGSAGRISQPWTFDERYSDLEKGYFTLRQVGCSGTGIGCESTHVYPVTSTKLGKPLTFMSNDYDAATINFANHNTDFEIREIRCARDRCSVLGAGSIEISNGWYDPNSNDHIWHHVNFESDKFLSPVTDVRDFEKLVKVVQSELGGERKKSPAEFYKIARNMFERSGVDFPEKTVRRASDSDEKSRKIEFILDGGKITFTSLPSVSVKLGERLSIFDIEERFSSGFKIDTDDECEHLDCIRVSKGDIKFKIQYDPKNGIVTGFNSYSSGISDANGKKRGDQLNAATGKHGVECHIDIETTCTSASLSGLKYIVGGCVFDVQKGRRNEVPDCAEIDGFITTATSTHQE